MASDNQYRGQRVPREIISYAVWFYYRFAVSFRDVYLWRAVDQNGVASDILVQPKRDRFAAMRKLLRANSRRCPRVIVTDKLRSYAAAKRVVMPGVAPRQHRYLNNGAENSHQPTREREKRMRRFKSAGHAQRFVEVHGIVGLAFPISTSPALRCRLPPPPKQTISNLDEVTGAAAVA